MDGWDHCWGEGWMEDGEVSGYVDGGMV